MAALLADSGISAWITLTCRDRNRVAVEALMVHGHIIAARRADMMRRDGDVGRAIYALQTDPVQLSST